MVKSDDREEVKMFDPNRELPAGERGRETHFEYIP